MWGKKEMVKKRWISAGRMDHMVWFYKSVTTSPKSLLWANIKSLAVWATVFLQQRIIVNKWRHLWIWELAWQNWNRSLFCNFNIHLCVSVYLLLLEGISWSGEWQTSIYFSEDCITNFTSKAKSRDSNLGVGSPEAIISGLREKS